MIPVKKVVRVVFQFCYELDSIVLIVFFSQGMRGSRPRGEWSVECGASADARLRALARGVWCIVYECIRMPNSRLSVLA